MENEDYIENDDEDIFKLIEEECYYDDKWLEEKERERIEK